uniref:Uncharacterized protein n=1 Tax=Aegilops tauschii subsp. strangulata TaxID=200361 RepID=A0A453D1X0_AEGTS
MLMIHYRSVLSSRFVPARERRQEVMNAQEGWCLPVFFFFASPAMFVF